MGKKQILNYLFFSILVIMLITSIISNTINFYSNIQQTITLNNFNVIEIITTLLLCLIIIYCIYEEKKRITFTLKKTIKNIFWIFLICLILLTFSSIYNLCNQKYSFRQIKTEYIKPSTSIQLIIMFFGVIISAIYEELVYRLYLPKMIKELSKDKLSNIVVILISSILFSLGHIHNGYLGLLHSFLSSLCLFFLLKKTESIASSCITHIIHNTLLIILMLK